MHHGNEEAAAGTEDCSHGGDSADEVVDVHECHLTNGAVEGSTVPPVQGSCDVRNPIADAQRLRCFFDNSCIDQPAAQINPDDLSASSGELT